MKVIQRAPHRGLFPHDEIRQSQAMQEALDDARKAEAEYRQAAAARITYEKVAQALAGDYFGIYIVDPDTDKFVEYSATKEYDDLALKRKAIISSM